jgi:L,D-transpeptidase ErfK/SrfK
MMNILLKILIILSFCLSGGIVCAADMILGGETTYVVQKGDNLQLVGAKHGVFWKAIAIDNNLDIKQPLTVGTTLKLNTRRIVPQVIDDGIIINIPDRTLYLFKGGSITFFPVGLGLLAKTEISDWRTPTGKFFIVSKRTNPTWYVPESIQLENALKGKDVEESVPPGPKNPLGKYAIKTSLPGLLIHSTIWPSSVYRYMSHGCIRMLPEQMEQLYPMVDIKTKGELIYEPVKIAVINDGRVYLEVRTDVYKKHPSIREYVKKTIETRGVADKVDWQRIDKLIKDETGIAEDITLTSAIQQAKTIKGPSGKNENVSFTQKIISFFRTISIN